MNMQQFGHWKVVTSQPIIGYKYYECECKCGTIKMIRGDGLLNGRSTQCIECRRKRDFLDPKDYIGKIYGKRTVISEGIPTKFQQRTVICKCECGLETTVTISRLKKLTPKSCHLCNVNKHGYEGTPTYNTWRTMKYRCYDTKHENYKHYGARGISVCDRWRYSFENFLADMGEKPEGKQIDRIDNNGNYEPGNCRWLTPKENCITRRKRPNNTKRASTREKQMQERLEWERKWIEENNKPR